MTAFTINIKLRRFSKTGEAAISRFRKLSDKLITYFIPFGSWCIYEPSSPLSTAMSRNLKEKT